VSGSVFASTDASALTKRVNSWASVDFEHCQTTFKTWSDLFRDLKGQFETGGLGKVMVVEKFESWVCYKGDPCLHGDICS
jgi:hypothetical protein